MAKKSKKTDGVFVPKKAQTAAQKKNNGGSNYFNPRFLNSEQKEKYVK